MNIYLNWSGGKDSSLCLLEAQRQGLPVNALLTSVNSTYNRISMHGVRRELLYQQAAALSLTLHTIEMPEQPGMQEYETTMRQKVQELQQAGFTHAMFGDIFLEDLRLYRETQLQQMNIEPLFPLWKRETATLMKEFIKHGFKAVVVCVNERFLNKSFCGREIDESFVNDLPSGVDICGENGEYHSFVYDGPVFSKPIRFTKGDIVSRQYKNPSGQQNSEAENYAFYFCDLLPA